MGASIHISGTGSSIIDTVLVCRSTGSVPRSWLAESPEDVADLVRDDLAKLQAGGVKPTAGDARCVAYGHLVRLAVWNLRKEWNRDADVSARLTTVSSWLAEFGPWSEIERHLGKPAALADFGPLFRVRELAENYGATHAEVPF
jgi:hypothetical protein